MRTTVIATGGTIAWHERQGRMLSGAELLAAAGQAADEVVDLGPVPSWDLSAADMAEIAGRARRAVREGSGGVVVMHGTDTMEETAWLTELTLGAALRRKAAVLFTGAMRFADAAGPDGPANLAWALRAAREPATAGRGVHVAWAGQLDPARWVRKAAGAPVLYAGDLTAEKAAIALMVGLGRHPRLGDLRAWWSDLLAAGHAGPGA